MNIPAIPPRLQRWLNLLRWLFIPVALIFVTLAAVASSDTIEAVLHRARFLPLAGAVALWAATHFLAPMFSWLLLRELGDSVPYRAALAIHAARLPARYLPGGIWHTVSRVADLHRLGVTSSRLSTMVVLENLVPVAVAAVLGGLLLGLAGGRASIAAVAAISGLMLMLLAPLASRHRRLRTLDFPRTPGYLRLSAIAAVFWLIAASAFAAYWSAFPAPDDDSTLLDVYGTYLLAWATGFVAVFAPQGVGVFEAVIATLLKGAVPFAGIVVLAAGFRVVVLAADICTYGIYALLRLHRRIQSGARN